MSIILKHSLTGGLTMTAWVMKRQVWQIPKAGSLARLRLVESELSDPSPDELTIQVEAVGLNFADIFACQGLYSATPEGAFVPGLEFSGRVLRAANGTSFREGDAVMGLSRFGAYATHLNIPASYVRPLPGGWTFAEGASYLVQALTAWYAIYELGNLRPGSVVLLHSAAGGVGLQALRILRAAEARVIATIGSDAKRELLKKQSLSDAQIITRNPRVFGKQLDGALSALPQSNPAGGFDLVLDALAGVYFAPAMQRLNPAGRYVLFGAAGFMTHGSRPNYLRVAWEYFRRPKLDPVAMISDNHSLMAFNLIWLWNETDRMARLIDEMKTAGLETTPPLVGHRFSFQHAPEALRALQSGKTTGKVVLEVANK